MAVLDAAGVVIETKPIRVDRVVVVGLKRTKDDIVEKATKCLFESKTIGDVIVKTAMARKNLMRLECFSDVSAELDVKNVNGEDDRYFVTIKVEESNRVQGHVKLMSDAHFDNNPDPKLSTGISLSNVFCRGEKLNVVSDVYSSNKKFSTGSVTFSKPLIAVFNPYLYTSVFKNHYNRSKFGYLFDEYGVNAGLNLYHDYCKVNLGWEGVVRDLKYASNSPFGIREQLGLSMKSSVKLTSTYDTRDNAVSPSYGSLFQWMLEVAGIGGNQEFVKHEFSLQHTIASAWGSAVTGSLSFGALNLFGKSSILDTFYLGGPLTFRGFEECGVGKKEDGSNTGSSLYWRTRNTLIKDIAEVDQLCWHKSNPDLLSTASGDKTVKVWDVRHQKCSNTILTKGENINITWSPDGHTIAVGNKEDLITFIDMRTLKPVSEQQFNFEVNEMSWNNESDLFFLTNGLGCVYVLSFPDLVQRHVVKAHPGTCICIEFAPSGKYFAVGSADASVSLWDLENLACVQTYNRLDWPVRALSFSYDGKMLASGSEDLYVDIADVTTGEKITDVPIDAATFTVAWHPKQYLLAFACDDKEQFDRKRDTGNLKVFGFSSE